jgi:hypothetical protein
MAVEHKEDPMWSVRRRGRSIAGLAAAAALLATTAVPAAAAELELSARMGPTAGFHHARGHAEYEAEHGRREFEISIAGARALHGKRVVVRVHGAFVGTMVVGSAGRAHLERHTSVSMRAGDVVRVRTQSGTLVTTGRFHRESH